MWGSRDVCLLGGWCLCCGWQERSLQRRQDKHGGGTSTAGAESVTSRRGEEDPEGQRQGRCSGRWRSWFGRAGSDVLSDTSVDFGMPTNFWRCATLAVIPRNTRRRHHALLPTARAAQRHRKLCTYCPRPLSLRDLRKLLDNEVPLPLHPTRHIAALCCSLENRSRSAGAP